MLVISRKKQQRVLFPNLGISIDILQISGNTVRVGIDAPLEIAILRGELTSEEEFAESCEKARSQRHTMRNLLHTANLSLHVLKKQISMGKYKDAQETVERSFSVFERLNQVAGVKKTVAETASANDGVGRRALIVEDNENERELLAGYLRLCGYQVESASDGVEALDFLENNTAPDLVLLDFNMPKMGGQQTIERIRSNPRFKNLKLFAVTGVDQNETTVQTGEDGVNGWFSKPITPDAFALALNAELKSQAVGS